MTNSRFNRLGVLAVIFACALSLATNVVLLVRTSNAPTAAEIAQVIKVPTANEIAQAVNRASSESAFQAPTKMEYVAKTGTCVVGGTVVATQWHAGDKVYSVDAKTYSADMVKPTDVDYTTFDFKSDDGRVISVSAQSALYAEPGERLGLNLYCSPATRDTATAFELIMITNGGK